MLGPDDSGWWKAELDGQFGWVPAAFFERVEDERAQVAADLADEAEIANAELEQLQATRKAEPLLSTSKEAPVAAVSSADAAPEVSDYDVCVPSAVD